MKFSKAATISTNIRGMAAQLAGSGFGTQIPQNIIDTMTRQGMNSGTPFSPQYPMAPRRAQGESPLQYEYIVGQNIVQRPRSTESLSFSTIDGIINAYDVAKLAIKVRVDQARTMDFNIRPYDESTYKERLPDIKKAEAFFAKPCANTLLSDFVGMLEHDRLSYDAMCFYKRFSRGGKLIALEPVDGRSVSPVIDFYGHAPLPPAPAYVQWIRGMPEVWLTRDTLVYRPYYCSSQSIYGTPPIENILMNSNTDIRTYLYNLMYFTEGNIPASFMSAPDGMTDATQIAQLQENLDTIMAGDAASKRRFIITPAGSTVKEMREFAPSTELSRYMLTLTCAAFDVVPSELGFTETSNKSSGDSQENVQMRRSQKPTMKFYSETFTEILHNELDMPDLKAEFTINNNDEDQLMHAQRHQIFVNTGIESRELAAEIIHGHAPTDGIQSGRTVTLGNEIISVAQIAEGYTGQGNTTETVEVAQKSVNNSLKKNLKFRNKKEEGFVKPFTNSVALELKKQGNALSLYAEQILNKTQKADDDMVKIAAIIALIDSQQWNVSLSPVLMDNVKRVFLTSMQENAKGLKIPLKTGETELGVFQKTVNKYAKEHAGTLITQLDNTTKDFVENALKTALENEMTVEEIAEMLKEDYAFSEGRAANIARTETGTAWNIGACETSRVAGFNAVLVSDGDHDEACSEANGQIWSIEYAESNPLEHNQCVRDFTVYQADEGELDN